MDPKAELQAPVQTTGETVTVACKLPNGLNLGHLHGPEKPIVILNGANHPNAIAGYGLTHGVDKDAFSKWLEDHGGPNGIPAVRLKHIFMYDKPGGAVEMARELTELKTGMEGLDPDAPAENIEPDDDQKKRTKTAKEKRAEKEAAAAAAHGVK